jgi:sugar phosphate isomerase/epimerase
MRLVGQPPAALPDDRSRAARRAAFRVGCQTYTWEMLGDGWRGRTVDILDAIAAAGYAGLEITLRMAGEFRDDPAGLRAACAARGLTLATLAYSSPHGFTDPARTAAELAAGEAAVAWAVAAGCRTFELGGAAIRAPGLDRAAARRHAATVYDALARRAAAAGLLAHLHPSSHGGSVIETAAEYEEILALTDPAVVHFGPDAGHILRGGGDPVALIRRHRARVVHIHLKDVAAGGAWAPLGEGICDVPALLALLIETGYDGWVMVEEESAAARADPAAAVARNRAWLRSIGY